MGTLVIQINLYLIVFFYFCPDCVLINLEDDIIGGRHHDSFLDRRGFSVRYLLQSVIISTPSE